MKERVVIYHNPRCSKSRATLQLLQERGIEPEIVLYLDSPPSPERLLELAELLGLPLHALLRRGEPAYGQLGLGPDTPPLAIARAVSAHPILLERPIVVVGDRAVLGRPPENVLPLL
jgi:arsenate reductase (glutaredoxin)